MPRMILNPISYRMTFKWVALCLLVLFGLSACVSGGGTKPVVDESVAANKLAMGDFRGAADAYLELAKRNRKVRDHFKLEAAEARRLADDWASVDAILADTKLANLLGDDLIRLNLLQAEQTFRRSDFQGALQKLATPLNPPHQMRQLELITRIHAANNDGLAAARTRLQIDALLTGPARRDNRALLANHLAAVAIPHLQQALGKMDARDGLRPHVERALRKRGQVPARVVMRPTRVAGTQLPNESGGWTREGATKITTLGVLLPLSGEFEGVGRAVLDGILAAYYADDATRPSIKIYDAGNTIDSAKAALKLAKDEGADQIIGPISREQVDALLDEASDELHLLALNQSDDGSLPPKNAQVFGLIPEAESAFVADELHRRNLKHVTLFVSSDDWSQRMGAAFRAQFDMLGGRIVSQQKVMTGASDIATAIGAALQAGSTDAVFMALRPEAARILASQWKASSGSAVPLFASSHVFGGSVSRYQDRDLDGVRFIDAPWVHNGAGIAPYRDALSTNLLSARASPRLFAFGMDAYRLAPFATWLSQHDDMYLPGATGQLSVDPFGRIQRLPAWMVFREGAPVNADGALDTEATSKTAIPPAT